MIFHCTKALAAKIPEVSISPLSDKKPMGSWHAHLLSIDRRHCVMFCHDSTRFILFQAGLRKEHFRNLEQIHKDLFRSALTSLGVPENIIKRIELVMGPAQFDMLTDRSVLSTLRQARSDFDSIILDHANILEVDPADAVSWLNRRPMTARGKWLWPE